MDSKGIESSKEIEEKDGCQRRKFQGKMSSRIDKLKSG